MEREGRAVVSPFSETCRCRDPELHAIPFEGQLILYRPWLRLALVGNEALARYAAGRLRGERPSPSPPVDSFLEAIGLLEPDPPPPEPWFPAGEHRPTTAALLMTTACNLRCTYCYAHGGEGPILSLSSELARAAIDAAHRNARARGDERFSLAFHGGGEPTLHWEVLREAVRHAGRKDLPCSISLTSNGLWTAEQRRFLTRHLSWLTLSFDGVREVQDTQRPALDGSGSFDRVASSIAAVDEAGVPYGIRMTATPRTFARLAEGVDLICRETGCPTIQVEPCYAEGRGEAADPSPEGAEAFARAFLEAFDVAAEAGRECSYSGARPWVIASAFCRAPEEALVVTPEGDLVACFEAFSRNHPLSRRLIIGRITAAGPEPDLRALRAFAAARQARREGCEGCFCRAHCAGDCVTRCVSGSGRQSGRCDVNRALTRELLARGIAAGEGLWEGRAIVLWDEWT